MSTLEKAIEIAARAHAGQIDKAGAPYVFHPLRLMLAVSGPYERMVAVLHDVVEDTAVNLGFTHTRYLCTLITNKCQLKFLYQFTLRSILASTHGLQWRNPGISIVREGKMGKGWVKNIEQTKRGYPLPG
jgi:hypothetical protein